MSSALTGVKLLLVTTFIASQGILLDYLTPKLCFVWGLILNLWLNSNKASML